MLILEKNFDFSKTRPHRLDFSNFNITEFGKLLREKDEKFWREIGEKRALKLFHSVAARVPAYQDFLRRRKVSVEKIKTIKDFAFVPIIDKKNYINAYPLKDRSWDGRLERNKLIAASSGSTGAPIFWPRGEYQEFEAAVIHELIYRYLFDIHKYKTLLVVGFPMGVYVSGLATVIPSLLISQKNYNLTIAAPGTNKDEILRIVKVLGRDYEQVVLTGHPFFIKDVLESGVEDDVKWRSLRLKVMLCSEGFSEKWRKYVLGAAGLAVDKPLSIVSTYGSSEFLLMAHETRDSLALKNKLEEKAGGLDGVFQYNPLFRYIEEEKGGLIFTAASGLPLIRYDLKDRGRIITGEQAKGEFSLKQPRWNLPFVTLVGRSDQAVVFYAANIYPEHIKSALNHPPFFKKLTGRFVMSKDYTPKMEEFLEINVELRKNIKSDLKLTNIVKEQVDGYLKKVNKEYLNSFNYAKTNITPRIHLKSYQDPKYFKPGLKPRYVSLLRHLP